MLGFYSELRLWKENSPAIFARCEGLDKLEEFDLIPLELCPIPPPAVQLLSTEMALSIAMYNAYLGCALASISITEDDPAARDREGFIFNLVYQNLCITAGLIANDNKPFGSPYKACDAVSLGISSCLCQGIRRSFSPAWQEWTIFALRAIGREGLSNGFTSANTLEILCQLETKMRNQFHHTTRHLANTDISPLGNVRDRLIPLSFPPGDDEQNSAFFLRYGNLNVDDDEGGIQVVAKATWKEDANGNIIFLKPIVYDSAILGYQYVSERPQVSDLFFSWRQEVEKGWHGFLTAQFEEGF